MPIPDRFELGFSNEMVCEVIFGVEYQILATKTKILLSEGISVRMRLLLHWFPLEWELTLDEVWKEFLLISTLEFFRRFLPLIF